MNWKDYVGSTDLIRATIPTMPGGIDKKKCHNGRYRSEDSIHAPPDYKSEPTCSANPAKLRPTTATTTTTTTTTHRKSQCGSHKNKNIFENILTQSCVLAPYMTRVM